MKPLRRILLVDDDPDILEVTTLLLSQGDSFDVRACGSAEEALRVTQQFEPDVILLDVMMPDLDGQGAIEAFRRLPATAATPVIFMTARVQHREIVEYRQLGSLGVIPKPFDPDTLADTIQDMWERNQSASANEERREGLATLRRVYARDLPERLRAIEAAAAALRRDGWDRGVAASLYEMAHRLAGSAAIYGFPAVSEAAMRIGAFASERPAGDGPVDARRLLELVAALSAALRSSLTRDEPVSPRS